MDAMTPWQKINQVFEDAEKLRKLEAIYMERGDVTYEQARQWALEKWKNKSVDSAAGSVQDNNMTTTMTNK